MTSSTDAAVDATVQKLRDDLAAVMANIATDRTVDEAAVASAAATISSTQALLASALADDAADKTALLAANAHASNLIQVLRNLGFNEDGTRIVTTPPSPAGDIVLTDMGGGTVKITWPAGVTPASYGQPAWSAPANDAWEFGQSLARGFALLTNIAAGIPITFTDTTGRVYTKPFTPTVVTPPVVVPPVITPPAGSGIFKVAGKKILRPDGKPIVLAGGNALGPNGWWDRPTLALLPAVTSLGFTGIRLNCNLPGGGYSTNNDLAGIVKAYTDARVYVMLELHTFGNGGYPDDGQLARQTDWCKTVGAQFKDNGYVSVNPMNEPGINGPVNPRWKVTAEACIAALRGVGFKGIIFFDGSAWGQDAGWGSTVITGESAFLTYGPGIIAKDPNVAFSFHVYNQWNGGDAKMEDYITRCQALGLCLIVGEAGDRGWVNSTVQDDTAAFDTVMRVAPKYSVGVLGWCFQGSGFVPEGSPGATNEGYSFLVPGGPLNLVKPDRSNLSHMGKAMVDFAKKVNV